MKLLLTSGGVTNPSIHAALVHMLGRPVGECHALVVPTAQWGHLRCGPASVRGLVAAEPAWSHFTGLGWASLGVLELTALQAPDDRALGVVDFAILPHLDAFPTNTLAHAERWAADVGLPAYAVDEQTAITVVDGAVEVVSEGRWTKLGP